jgi:class 3 adenylate cyclase
MTTTTTPATAPTTLPGVIDIWARLVAVVLVFAVGIGGFFALDHDGDVGARLVRGVLVYSTFFIVGSGPVAWWLARPLGRLQAALATGTPATQLPADDIVAALRLPGRILGLVVGVTVGVGAAFSVAMLDQQAQAAPWPVFFIGSLCLAVITATAHGYALQRLVSTRVAPVLLADGRLDHLGPVAGYRTFHHLAGLVFTLGLAWPTLGYLVLRFGKSPGAGAVAGVVVLYVVTTTAQMFGALQAISRPAGHLRERLLEIGAGHLDTRARIDALDTFGEVSSAFNHMVDGLKQRELLKETFGRYVTQQVADEILAGRVRLGGERRTATVLFSDIRGFTTLSEQLSPEEVVAFLNEFLEMMVDCVLEHGGVLDKFIGDAVLAVFGVPVSRGSVEADARAAVACARTMGERLAALNEQRVAAGKAPIRIGIGVHTGELVAGNIGSPRRMQYTVIGDTVNVGSRLESLTKDHHRRTLLSGATAALVGDSVPLVALGTATVRGRQEPLALFGIEGEAA